MKLGKRLTVCVLSGLLVISLAGCGGKKKDVYTVRNLENGNTLEVSKEEAAQYQNNEDWEIFAPGADIPEWKPGEAVSDDGTEDVEIDTEYGPVDPDSLGNPEEESVAETETEDPGMPPDNGPTEAEDDSSRVASQMYLVSSTDVDATNTLCGLERELMISAWGAPDNARDHDGGIHYDMWNLKEDAGVEGNIRIVYDKSDVVIEAILTTNGGKTTGIYSAEGGPSSFWEDISNLEFASWAASHTPQEVMDRVGNMTRTSICAVLGNPIGYWTDGGRLSGDVFKATSQEGKDYWIAVGYKTTNHVVPDYVLMAECSSGNPDLPNYQEGIYEF